MPNQKFYHIPGGGTTGFLSNGLVVSISRNDIFIRRLSDYLEKEHGKIYVKQYEVSKEVFNEKLRTQLEKFPELKGVINA